MFVKYIYADRDNHKEKDIHLSWIRECEKCNYIFEVLGESGDRWKIKTKDGYSNIRKERCKEYIDEYVTLPKELFEI